MLPVLNIIENVSGLVGGVLDRLWPSDKDKAEVEKVKAEIGLALKNNALAEDSAFRSFMLEYEGSAKDSPWLIQVLRASVRPLLTYLLIGTTAWLVWQGREIPAQLHQLDLLCAGFWFGERAVRNYIKAKQEK